MDIQLIVAPYDSGHFNQRMGAGPLHFLSNGLATTLQAAGHQVSVNALQLELPFSTEIGTSVKVQRAVATAARSALQQQAFPLLLAGNCNSSIGMVKSSEADALIWFDGHGDFNTPETTISGFFDGMALAMLLGRCFRGLLGTEYHPIPETHAVHVGGRDFDLEEWKQLQQSSITVISPDEARESGIDRALSVLEQKARRVHIHFDLDVLDDSIGSANEFAVPNGLSLSDAQRIIKQIRQRLSLVSASVSAYDPSCDPEGKILQAGTQLIGSLVD